MFDIGWTELLLIGVVALIVIGPKDLPQMFFQIGRMVARLKSMAREFQGAMTEAARASGLEEVSRDVSALGSLSSPTSALKQAADRLEKWDPLAGTGAGTTGAGTGAQIPTGSRFADPVELDAAELEAEPELPKAKKAKAPAAKAPATEAGATKAAPKPRKAKAAKAEGPTQ